MKKSLLIILSVCAVLSIVFFEQIVTSKTYARVVFGRGMVTELDQVRTTTLAVDEYLSHAW